MDGEPCSYRDRKGGRSARTGRSLFYSAYPKNSRP